MPNRASTSNNPGKPSVPGARKALDNMKMEIANELGIDLNQYNKGETPSRVAGSMVKRMIELQEKAMSEKGRRS